MTMRDDQCDEQFSQLLSSYEDARFDGHAPPAETNVESSPPAAEAVIDFQTAQRLARTKRCLALLDEAWPRDGKPQRALPLDVPEIDRFEIVRELGRGGFGIVYLADDPKLGRAVALKIQRPETILSAELRRRFLREAKTAAILAHPNIVAVYDAEVAGVRCWIASEYCAGTTLKEWLRRRRSPVAARPAVQLVLALAEAVSYAHTRGVLHRDIKPSNVLLQPKEEPVDSPSGNGARRRALHQTENVDGLIDSGELDDFSPKLADFGLARFDDESAEETRSGAQLGTPAYMAPEQIEGDRTRVDRRTDVYELGVLLYEVLTGRLPFDGQTRTDTLTQVLLKDPPRPRQLRRDLPRDLEAIVLRCLEKRPERRYHSALALADDLRRFLNNEPTQARPLGTRELLVKWARRHPAVALALAVVLLILPLVILVIAQKNAELSAALAQTRTSERINAHTVYGLRMRQAWNDYNSDDMAAMEQTLHDYEGRRREDFCGFELDYLRGIRARLPTTLRGDSGQVYTVSFSPDGRYLASGAEDRTIKLWEVATGRCISTFIGHQADVNCVVFSPDGKTLASASDDGTVRLWAIDDPASCIVLDQHEAEVVCVRYLPGAQRLISADADGVVIVWDLELRRPIAWLQRHQGRIESLDVSPDGRLLLTGGEEHDATPESGASARIWDLLESKEIAANVFPGSGVECVAFDRLDGGYYVGDIHGNLTQFSRDGKQFRFFDFGSEQLKAIAVSSDGRTRAVAGDIKRIVVDHGDPIWPRTTTLHGHGATVWDLAISPNGKTLASASRDGTVRIWDAWNDPRYNFADCGQATPRAIDSTATHAARVSKAKSVFLQVVGQPEKGVELDDLISSGSIKTVGLGCQKPWLAIGTDGGSVAIFDYERRREVGRIAHTKSPPDTLRFSADDRTLQVIGSETTELTDVSDPMAPRRLVSFQTIDSTFSRCGDWLAVSQPSWNGVTEIWNGSPQWHKAWSFESPTACRTVFSYDGRFVVLGDGQNTIHVRETATAHEVVSFNEPDLSKAELAITSDGKTLAMACNRRLKLWSVPTKMLVLEFDLPIVPRLEFTADDSRLILVGPSWTKLETLHTDRPTVPESPDAVVNPTRFGVVVLPTAAH